jgi:ribosomal protein L29
MNNEQRKSILASISSIKKDLLINRVKISSGESVSTKEQRQKRKEIARLFTKLNAL